MKTQFINVSPGQVRWDHSCDGYIQGFDNGDGSATVHYSRVSDADYWVKRNSEAGFPVISRDVTAQETVIVYGPKA